MLPMSLANKIFSFVTILFSLFISVSCKNSSRINKTKPLIIWTDNPEIVSYVELFNSLHDNISAVAIYKQEAARSLPPTKDELVPDLVIASWLKNSMTRKYFAPLDYLFTEKSLNRSLFYKKIFEYGTINDKQYLIPVSFNLPTMIFSKKNELLIDSPHFLDLKQIKTNATKFNQKNQNGNITNMGYAPSWEEEFLYLVTKLYGTSYHEKGTSFIWNENAMEKAISEIKQWTITCNTDTTSEQNFQFRYLYMPNYKQIETDRSLFSYIPSNKLFMLTDDRLSEISFRWIEQDNKIPVEDDIITLGLYKKAEHTAQAEIFISWFMQVETQKLLIERTKNMKLDTVNFGIAGGFSSLRDVNEKYYPTFYRQLLGNMPPEEYLVLPNILPYRWESLKAHVIIPYLKDSTDTNSSKKNQSLETRISEWTKQFY